MRGGLGIGRWPDRVLGALLALGLTVALVGCAGSGLRSPASRLGADGAALATAAQGSLGGVRGGLDRYVESQYLRSGLLESGVPPSPQQVEDIRGIQRAIVLRERALSDLAQAYLAFQALGTYDAAAEVEGRVGALNQSVNAFAAAVGRDDALVSNVGGGLITRAGRALAGAAQDAKIRKASALLREHVTALDRAMQTELGDLRGISLDVAEESARLRAAMREEELLKDSPVLDDAGLLVELIGVSGVQIDAAKSRALIEKHGDRLRDALRAIRADREAQEFARQADVLEATIAALGALASAHEQLERGQDLSLQSLQARIAAVTALVEEYKKWRALDEAAKAATTTTTTTTKPAT